MPMMHFTILLKVNFFVTRVNVALSNLINANVAMSILRVKGLTLYVEIWEEGGSMVTVQCIRQTRNVKGQLCTRKLWKEFSRKVFR